MAVLRLKDIKRVYSNGFIAVQEMSLNIEHREFVAFLGPLGCGKSTVLRMIAGLEEISAGELYIDDKQVNHLPPIERNIALVFKNNALYPLLSIYDNLAFGLKLHNVARPEIDRRVQNAAGILGIEHLLEQKPEMLTENERRLVTIGRAIVREPVAFLMEDPLFDMDEESRKTTLSILKRLHQELDATFIYVTQNPQDAMELATKTVVMNDGIVQQIDKPEGLYGKPANLFVACYVNTPIMNIIEVVVREQNHKMYLEFGSGNLELPDNIGKNLIDYADKEVYVGIHAQDLCEPAHFSLPATVLSTELSDSKPYYHLHCEGHNFTALLSTKPNIGEMINLPIDPTKIHIFDKETERNLL